MTLIFFSIFSSLMTPVNELEFGDEVEFTFNRKNPKNVLAENIRKIKSGSSASSQAQISPTMYRGTIIDELKFASTSPDKQQPRSDEYYYGKVVVVSVANENKKGKFGELIFLEILLYS